MARMTVGRSRCLCKCERGWSFVEGGGVKGKPLMMRAGWEVMSRCTIVVNWLVVVVGVRGAIVVMKLGWCSIGLAGVRRRVRVWCRSTISIKGLGMVVCITRVGGW